MKTFPPTLHVSNKENFSDLNLQRTLAYMRKCIYEHMISQNEEVLFDLTEYREQYSQKNMWIENIVEPLRGELHSIGWNTKLSFGDSALFIYSTEYPPSTCWDGKF